MNKSINLAACSILGVWLKRRSHLCRIRSDKNNGMGIQYVRLLHFNPCGREISMSPIQRAFPVHFFKDKLPKG